MSINKHLVTIVTVIYNAREFLENTIKSVIEQDYSNMEYIIIDGASTDGTLDVIKKYEKYINYWISENDDGIYDAMNKGVDKATGMWINFLNAGDTFIDKSTITSVVKNIDNNTDIISGDIYVVNKQIKKLLKPLGENNIFQGMFYFHPAMFIKKEILKKIKFNTLYQVSADYDFNLKAYFQKSRYKYISIPIANYLSGGKSDSVLSAIEDLFILSKYINEDKLVKSYPFKKLLKYSNEKNYCFSELLNIFIEKINNLPKAKYIIYGYSNFTQVFLRDLDEVIAIADRNAESIKIKNIIQPEAIKDYNFDKIIIAVLGREKEIKYFLINKLNIKANKIINF